MGDQNSTRRHLNSLGYNPTMSGLGSLAQGLSAGLSQGLQNRIAKQQIANQTAQIGYENPYRTPSELDRLKVMSNPLYQMLNTGAINQAVATAPTSQNGYGQPVAQNPVASVGPSQQAQANVQQATNQNLAPVPVTQWTSDDFMAFQAELKKRQSKGTA